MDAELKAKWVEALRSGDFIQGPHHFRRRGKHCCLGVLCEIAGQPTKNDDEDNWPFVDDVLKGDDHRAPKTIGDMPLYLAHLNDDEGKSFSEIADYIEANL